MNAHDSFIAFLTDAQNNLTYSNGSYSESKHEDSIFALLIQHGFKEFNKGDLKGYSNVKAALPVGHFVTQPAGKNGNPDFLIRFANGHYQDLEAKSTKGSKPMYNGVPPKEGCIYILSSERHNQTAVFHADDIMTAADRQRWSNYVKDLRKVDAAYNASQTKATGYARQMYDDKNTKHFDVSVRTNLFDRVIGRF